MYFKNENIHLEHDDQCISCKHMSEGKACPLIQAISMKIVAIKRPFKVSNCGFFVKFVRRLKLVKSD